MLLMEHLGLELHPRSQKPRKAGITSVIDSAQPLSLVESVLETHIDYIDIIKFTDSFMTAPLWAVEKRIAIYKRYNVDLQPNGAYFEIARLQGREREVLQKLRAMGFTHLEVSSSTTEDSSAEENIAFARLCQEYGWVTIGEVGKKFPEGDRTRKAEDEVDVDRTLDEMEAYLKIGVEHIYWEGHILRRVIGETPEAVARNYESACRQIHAVVDRVGAEHIVFEVTSQLEGGVRRMLQQWLIREFGPEVNLGNTLPADVPFLEHMRRGTKPVHEMGHAGDHPWIRSLSATHEGRAEAGWWQK